VASAAFKLGRLLPAPAEFLPTKTIVGSRYIYRLDTKNLICHRRPKLWSDDAPAGYYQLVLSERPKQRKQLPAAILALKHGVLVPTLVAGLAAGLILVLYPLLPGIKYQVQKQLGSFSNTAAVAAPDPTHNRLIIPKIGVDTTIWEGPTLGILNNHVGVWHQTGDISGNFVVAGHRWKYLPPNTSTFYNLGEIQVGDTIIVDWYGTRHIYTVSQTEQIDQNNTSILKPTSSQQVTVYTCYDKRQTQRIVVIAKPQP